MKISIVTVGRKSSAEISKLCSEYEKRLSKDHDIHWKLINSVTGKMSREEQKMRESKKILESVDTNDIVVLLDETGQQLYNSQFAETMKDWQLQSRNVVFVIGGAFGVSDELKQAAGYTWALSSLVFPHEIVRLILIEQLYRTQSIIDGLPYHHN